VQGQRLRYDANGNLTSRAGLSLVWNVENRLASATATGGSGSMVESYLYNDAGARVKKVSNGVTDLLPFPALRGAGERQRRDDGDEILLLRRPACGHEAGDETLTLPAQRLPELDADGDAGHERDGQERYYAYGKDRHPTGTVPTDNRFTGQKEDATGLVYMNARYYDPVLGQFVSPDTLVPDATNLFDYNRYMYVRGNPLKFTDPTGIVRLCHHRHRE
jgi:RHS repeat-associated protein